MPSDSLLDASASRRYNIPMSVFWNTRTRELSPYIPGEQPQNRKYIKLNTNENPYPPSPKVIAAAQDAAAESLRLYPDPECGAFRHAIAERYGIKDAQVFAGNGSDEILAFAFGAFFESGEHAPPILFPDITYSFYPVYARLWNIPFHCPLVRPDFSIDAADYRVNDSAIHGGAGGIIFPNPNAPTGLSMPNEDVLSIVQSHAKLNCVVIIDEAYTDFSDEPSMLTYIEENPNLLVIRTLSKSASLAGLRAAFAIGNEALIEGLRRIRDSFNSYTVDRIAQAAGAAAVLDAPYYEDVTRKIIATRERVAAALSGMGFTTLPSSANFLFTRHPSLSGADFCKQLREAGVLVRRFNMPRIADFARVSIGTDAEMDTFLNAAL